MKQYTCQLVLLFFLSLFFSSPLPAKENSPAELLENLVTIENSSFIIDKHLYCLLSLPLSLGGGAPFNSVDMHVRFSAPATGLISRDLFVALSMRMFTEAKIHLASEIPGLTTAQTMQAMQCSEVAAPQQKTDYDYTIKMTSDGVESTFKNTNRGTQQITNEPWSVVLRTLPKKK